MAAPSPRQLRNMNHQPANVEWQRDESRDSDDDTNRPQKASFAPSCSANEQHEENDRQDKRQEANWHNVGSSLGYHALFRASQGRAECSPNLNWKKFMLLSAIGINSATIDHGLRVAPSQTCIVLPTNFFPCQFQAEQQRCFAQHEKFVPINDLRSLF